MATRFKTFDIWLLLLPLFLSVVGVVVIYSITVGTSGTQIVTRQVIFLLIGLLLYLIFAFMDYRALKSWSWVLFSLGIASLILVLVLGQTTFGAQRWINLGFFQFQPSELMKLSLIIGLAMLFSERVGKVHIRRLILAWMLILMPVALILKQPDLGSAITVFLIGLAMLMHVGLNKRQWASLISLFIILLAVGLLSWFKVPPFKSLIKEYQRERIETFIDPQADPGGSGYNILQATIAIGSGGVFGKGLGFGSQSQLNFLPVAHTDFIFAALAESWGFVGTMAVLVIYIILIWRIVGAATMARDDFSMLFCIGIASLLLIQFIINIGMNMQLLPVTGLTLPFISSGGTSLLTCMIELGMVQSVVIREKYLYK